MLSDLDITYELRDQKGEVVLRLSYMEVEIPGRGLYTPHFCEPFM